MQRNKDNRFIERIYEKYKWLIYKIAKQKLGEHHLAEDVVQETLIKLMKYPGKLMEASEKSPADEKNYVSRVANNAANDMLKRRGKDLNNTDTSEAEQTPDTHGYSNPERYVISQDSERRIIESIGNLDRKYRDPLLLQRSNGFTIEQIADIIGVSESTVTKRLARAKSILKETLERTENEDE